MQAEHTGAQGQEIERSNYTGRNGTGTILGDIASRTLETSQTAGIREEQQKIVTD